VQAQTAEEKSRPNEQQKIKEQKIAAALAQQAKADKLVNDIIDSLGDVESSDSEIEIDDQIESIKELHVTDPERANQLASVKILELLKKEAPKSNRNKRQLEESLHEVVSSLAKMKENDPPKRGLIKPKNINHGEKVSEIGQSEL
jgi:hypothetical protein